MDIEEIKKILNECLRMGDLEAVATILEDLSYHKAQLEVLLYETDQVVDALTYKEEGGYDS